LLNYATIPFYWRAFEPERGRPRYQETRRMVQWCRSHAIAIKGHPLAWNLADPPWLPTNVEVVRKLLFERIAECVVQFKDQIRFWDVVNEATEFDRTAMEKEAPLQTEVIRGMGPVPYIREAFRLARESDPGAALLINDYVAPSKYLELLSEVAGNNGTPVFDAIGIQSHQHTGVWTPMRIWDVSEQLAATGRPVHFTETTIISGALQRFTGPPKSGWNTTQEGEREQAADVERFYTIAFSNPAVEAISWWDFSDEGAWKGAPAGLLRRDMSPKPAYVALKGLIKGKWWTREDATVSKGEARLRAFYGSYKVTLSEKGHELTGTFAFDRHTSGPIQVQLQ
jgi:endo-1,4-beta-xylanase